MNGDGKPISSNGPIMEESAGNLILGTIRTFNS